MHGTQEGSFTQTKALHPIQWEIRIALRGGLCVVMVDPVLGKEKANRGPVGQVEVRKEVEASGRPGIFLGGVREAFTFSKNRWISAGSVIIAWGPLPC